MIDHILFSLAPGLPFPFVDGEGELIEAPYIGAQTTAVHNGGRVDVLGIKVIRAPAVLDTNGDLLTPEECAPGHWWAVRAGERLQELTEGLVVVTDNERAKQDRPFILHVADGYGWDSLRVRIWPYFNGDDYPWQSIGPGMLIAA